MSSSPLLDIELICPTCLNPLTKADTLNLLKSHFICPFCNSLYPIVNSKPVLVPVCHRNIVHPLPDYMHASEKIKKSTLYTRSFKHLAWIPTLSVNLSRKKALANAFNEISSRISSQISKGKTLVIGCGNDQANILAVSTVPRSLVTFVDIDTSAKCDLIADAHCLPFSDSQFDFIIVTAVLEHVLSPASVIDELIRVSSKNALIYSEVPFLQPLHEYPYDFQRYTLHGHRLLFSHYFLIEYGITAGPISALLVFAEALLLNLFPLRSSLTRSLFKLPFRIIFSWLKYFDYLLPSIFGIGGLASCTYFYGRLLSQPIPSASYVRGLAETTSSSHV
jgi:uncharacterized protein YbaR (Trm112 family)/SAM-dependent methyltransferase